MATEPIPLLVFPGMTPDERLFARLLPLLPNARVVEWIRPLPRESIRAYAERIAKDLPRDNPCFIAGVSFGGIVAQEITELLRSVVPSGLPRRATSKSVSVTE